MFYNIPPNCYTQCYKQRLQWHLVMATSNEWRRQYMARNNGNDQFPGDVIKISIILTVELSCFATYTQCNKQYLQWRCVTATRNEQSWQYTAIYNANTWFLGNAIIIVIVIIDELSCFTTSCLAFDNFLS